MKNIKVIFLYILISLSVICTVVCTAGCNHLPPDSSHGIPDDSAYREKIEEWRERE